MRCLNEIPVKQTPKGQALAVQFPHIWQPNIRGERQISCSEKELKYVILKTKRTEKETYPGETQLEKPKAN